MDNESLKSIRDIVFSRIREIVFDRYHEFIPPNLIDSPLEGESSLKAIEGFESFKADVDLLELFEALRKIVRGTYGYCLLCRKDIDVVKLKANPVAKFCDECARILGLSYHPQEIENLQI